MAELFDTGTFAPLELADLFGISKASLYRIATPGGSASSRDSGTGDPTDPSWLVNEERDQ